MGEMGESEGEESVVAKEMGVGVGSGVYEAEDMSEGTSAGEHLAAVQMQSLVRGHIVRRSHPRADESYETSNTDLADKAVSRPRKISKHFLKAEKGIEVARQRREAALAQAKQREEEERRKKRRIKKSWCGIRLLLLLEYCFIISLVL